jgi:hypothetical protein
MPSSLLSSSISVFVFSLLEALCSFLLTFMNGSLRTQTGSEAWLGRLWIWCDLGNWFEHIL